MTLLLLQIVACLASANRRIKIESLHEFGQLCHPEEDLAAFSPDAITGVVEETPEGKSHFVALVEIKSKCSEVILTREKELVGEFGEYEEINIEEDPEVFKKRVPRCVVLVPTSPWHGFGLFKPRLLRCCIAAEDNPCGLSSHWVLETRIVSFCDCKSGTATWIFNGLRRGLSSSGIQSRVPCS